ncbi:MAG: histidine phosphatase family protein [Parvularculaceae bacterium]
MRYVTLMRHAEARRADGLVEDVARPLTKEGRKAALAMGRFMAKRRLRPDVILTSPSLRTMETAARVQRSLGPGVRLICAPRLYDAASFVMIEEIARAPANCAHALVVGHNPGLHRAANELADAVRSAAVPLNGVKETFPTAAIAHFEFGGDSWQAVTAGAGALTIFKAPD